MSIVNLNQIRQRLNNAKSLEIFDELDTIERLIVLVISLVGWQVDSITPMYLQRGNRDNRSSHRRFDLELYLSQKESPRFVFECKSLNSPIKLLGKGAPSNTSDHSDYVRQLRNDCLSNNFSYKLNWTSAVLTNGEQWVIFGPTFVENGRKEESISEENKSDLIQLDCQIKEADFEQKINKYLSKLVAEQGA